MKINPKITKRVNDSVCECRKVLVSSIIELLKSISKTDGYDVIVFNDVLFLYQSKGNTTETILVDRIEFNYLHQPTFFFVLMDDVPKMCKSSNELSLTNLMIIFEEVRKLVRNY